MQRTQLMKVPAGLVVLLFVASSCGGGVSREDFAAEVEPVCDAVRTDLESIPEPQSPEELVVYLERAVEITDSGVAAIRTAEAPGDDEEAVDEWIDTLEQSRDKIEEALGAAQAGDQAGIDAAFAKADQLNSEANDLAGDLGLDACSQD